jgi:hypothetical protein
MKSSENLCEGSGLVNNLGGYEASETCPGCTGCASEADDREAEPTPWTVEQVVALARGLGMREGSDCFFYAPGKGRSLFPSRDGEIVAVENGPATFLKTPDAAAWLLRTFAPECMAA